MRQEALGLSIGALWRAISPGCAARADPMDAEGKVVEASAGAPVDKGATCTLHLKPDRKPGMNCRVTLKCGSVELFGGSRVGGYASCEVDDKRRFTRAVDEKHKDGDPAIDVDLGTGRVKWTDIDGETTIEIALDDAAGDDSKK